MRFIPCLAAAVLASLPVWATAQQLTVSAAASLSDAFKEVAGRFESGRPGVKLRLNFAASGVLLQQVAQGAPVDVFASADQATVNRGLERKLFDADSRRDFAGNTLVLVAPAQGGAAVHTLADLGSAGVRRIAIGKTTTSPAGRYAREALEAAGFWSRLEPKLVYADSVRQVLDYVARGEVDAGFVYRTDAAMAADRTRVALTLDGHTPISYPAIVVSDSRHKALAREFIAFLGTPPAQEVLARHGFGKP